MRRAQHQQHQHQRHRPSLPADDCGKERGSTLSGGMSSVLQGLRRPQRRQRQHQYTRTYASSSAAATTFATDGTITSANGSGIAITSSNGSGRGSGSFRPRFPSFVATGLLSLLAAPTCFAAPSEAKAKVVPNGAMVWDGNGWLALVDDPSSPSPPPPKTESWKSWDTRLFVGVSSFRDKRCPKTLMNYFTKAKYPSRVTVGVVQQNAHEDVDCVTEYCNLMGGYAEGPGCPHFANIKTLRVEAKHAAGPCYGRHLQVQWCPPIVHVSVYSAGEIAWRVWEGPVWQ